MLQHFLKTRDWLREMFPDNAPLVNAEALRSCGARFRQPEATRVTYVRWVNRQFRFYGDRGHELASAIPPKVRGA